MSDNGAHPPTFQVVQRPPANAREVRAIGILDCPIIRRALPHLVPLSQKISNAAQENAVGNAFGYFPLPGHSVTVNGFKFVTPGMDRALELLDLSWSRVR